MASRACTRSSPHTVDGRAGHAPSLAVGFVVVVLLLLAPSAQAQRSRSRRATKAQRAPSADTRTPERDASAQTEIREEGKEKVKVIKFSGLDISGKLKSPQLLYFLNRLRAEFDRPRLPHRSFMPELDRSTKGKPF